MVNKYILYRKAAIGLENIVHYISVELSNPKAAMSVLGKIEKRIQDIMKFPLVYPLIESNKLIEEGLRKSIVDSYLIIYLVNKKMDQVEIVNIMYYREDYLWEVGVLSSE